MPPFLGADTRKEADFVCGGLMMFSSSTLLNLALSNLRVFGPVRFGAVRFNCVDSLTDSIRCLIAFMCPKRPFQMIQNSESMLKNCVWYYAYLSAMPISSRQPCARHFVSSFCTSICPSICVALPAGALY